MQMSSYTLGYGVRGEKICPCLSSRCVSSKTSGGTGQVVDSGEDRQSLQLKILAAKARFDRNEVDLHFTEGMTRARK